jgi:AAA domain
VRSQQELPAGSKVRKKWLRWPSERDPRSGYTLTPAFDRLLERVKQHETEVLIVDGIADTFAGNENARSDVKRFVNSLVSLIPTATGAVLLIGHVAKPAAANAETTEGYSGSTGWHNSVRARWYLYPETRPSEDRGPPERTGDLILELQKSQRRTDQQMRFRWNDEVRLFVGQPVGGGSRFDRQHRGRTEQDGIRRALKAVMAVGDYVPAAMTGPRTAFHVVSSRTEFPETLRSGRARFWRHIESLRAMRHVEESSITRETDRHAVRTLVLSQDGLRACGQCRRGL